MSPMNESFTRQRTSYELSTEKWVFDTCELLCTNSWPTDRPLIIDLSAGWSPQFLETGMVSLLESLSRNTTARTLRFKNVILDSLRTKDAFKDMLTHNKSLRSITLQNVKGTGSSSIALPAEVFGTSSLQELVIERCNMDCKSTTALGDMVEENAALRKLVLSEVNLEAGFAEMAKSLSNLSVGIETLEISNTRLCGEDLSQLLQAITSNASLINLSLESLHLGLKEVPLLAKVLKYHSKLIHLGLRGNNLNCKCIQILVQGLVQNRNLHSLSLSCNPVGDEGAMYLTDCLVNQSFQLRNIDLEFAEIWEEGCLALAKGLSSMVGLERLDLAGNDMENCATELLKSVVSNMTIRHISGIQTLSLGGTDGDGGKTAEQWKKVAYFLRLNRSNRRILTSPSALSMWPQVLERSSNDPAVLFYMLRQAPYIASRSTR